MQKQIEIRIIGDDNYEYNIDEIEMISIRNKLGRSFDFKPDEIKSIELLFPDKNPELLTNPPREGERNYDKSKRNNFIF